MRHWIVLDRMTAVLTQQNMLVSLDRGNMLRYDSEREVGVVLMEVLTGRHVGDIVDFTQSEIGARLREISPLEMLAREAE